MKKSNGSLGSTLASNIILFRQRKHMTQVDLAKKTKFSQSYISALEIGNRSPSFSALAALAKALDVHPHDLLLSDAS